MNGERASYNLKNPRRRDQATLSLASAATAVARPSYTGVSQP
jgi:hypothetical protein